MVKVTMAHHSVFRSTLLVLVLTVCLVKSQLIYQAPIRPLYFVVPRVAGGEGNSDDGGNNDNLSNQGSAEPVAQARSGVAADSSEETEDGSPEVARAGPGQRINATVLPRNFDEAVRANSPPEARHAAPLYGDPAVMDDDDERERPRFLWPFQTSVTITKQKRPHYHGPPHHGPPHLSGGYAGGPPLLPPHLQPHHGHNPHDLEYEKTRLKYEIYKLKAKKTIAILQNKVELKKIMSLLLQQKIKALEWITWYHDYVEQMFNAANGGGGDWNGDDGGDGWGWGESKYLTDEEILHSKGKSSSSSSYSWSSLFGGGLLSRLRSTLNLDSKNDQQQQQQQQQSNNAPPPSPTPSEDRYGDDDDDDDDDDDNDEQVESSLPSPPPSVGRQEPLPQTQPPSPQTTKKPFYHALFKNPLLKYLGFQKDEQKSSPSPPPPRPPLPYERRHDLANPSRQPQQSRPTDHDDESEEKGNKSSAEDVDENRDDDDDSDDDGHSDEGDKSNEDAKNQDAEHGDKEGDNDEQQEDNEDEENEEANEEHQEDEEPDKETHGEGEEEETKNESQEQGTTEATDVTPAEAGEAEQEEEEEEEKKPIDKLNIDIDEELADIDLGGNNYKRRPLLGGGLKNKLFRTGVPGATPQNPQSPVKKTKEKRKDNLKKKVYSLLFKTMDALDKKFMDGNDDDDDLFEARKTQKR